VRNIAPRLAPAHSANHVFIALESDHRSDQWDLQRQPIVLQVSH
jgi:hypothetical protein